jgi:tRNA U55 pseudouridine synthase TruB
VTFSPPVLGVGDRATKLLTSLLDADKVPLRTVCLGRVLTACAQSYRFSVLFGRATDTCECDSSVVLSQADGTRVPMSELERAMNLFRGSFMQAPPVFVLVVASVSARLTSC